MEESFSDLIDRLFYNSEEGEVQVLHLSGDWQNGILKIKLRGGRKFTVHFEPTE